MANFLKTALFSSPKTGAVSFEDIYQEHLPRIYNFFLYRFGDIHTAEDLTAVTFEKAWKNRAAFRQELASISTWLFTIARRSAIDFHRKKHPQVESLEDAPLIDDETPDLVLDRKTDLRVLNALLRDLPARERELIALKYGANLTNRAIARLTGLSESNIGVILYRTVRGLKKAWEETNER